MTHTLNLQCQCGAIQGTITDITRKNGARVVCYCDDCQCYAHHLGAEELLDPHGGTEVYLTSPAQVQITAGLDHVACTRLSPKGLMRWHCRKCNTPFANTLPSPKVPFIGVNLAVMADPETAEKVGPIKGKIMGRFAQGGCPSDAHPKAGFGLLSGAGWLVFKNWARGKARPSPVRNEDGSFITEPTVLSKETREALKAKVSAS